MSCGPGFTDFRPFLPRVIAAAPGLPDVAAQSYLRDAAIRFCETTGWLEREAVVPMSCGVYDYPIVPVDCERVVRVVGVWIGCESLDPHREVLEEGCGFRVDALETPDATVWVYRDGDPRRPPVVALRGDRSRQRRAGGVLRARRGECDEPAGLADPRDDATCRGHEAFGRDRPIEDPDGDGLVFNLDMRFPGQRFDAPSELTYNYFRDYDAATGRYVESDPTGLNDGVATYSYVASNPSIAVDPSGQSKLRDIDAGDGIINVTRDELERYMSAQPLSKRQEENLDRGCIGLASAYQGLNQDFPEDAPRTTCYLDRATALLSVKNCKKSSFVFGKQGKWNGGAPKPDSHGVVPNHSISSAGGNYNYVTYFQGTKDYGWMNHSNAVPGQRGYVYRAPPKDPHYPHEIWCVTCK